MTQEEKFKEAKRLYETANADQKYVLERLFPELKESEGETMRKVAIEACKYMADNFENSTQWYEDAIAWLEKGEQKPAWSEEDEKILQNIISDFEHAVTDEKTIKEELNNRVKFLKSLKDRVQLQPKQEWNQNDIDMIDWLIRCCEKEHEELCNDKYGHQDIVSDLKRDCRKKWNWLESLKNKVVPQNRWKPSDLPHWKKSTLPNDNTTGFNSDYFCYKGYNINYKELFEKLPKDD